jgi:hypothetical protein
VVDTKERILYIHLEIQFWAAKVGIDQASVRAKPVFAKPDSILKKQTNVLVLVLATKLLTLWMVESRLCIYFD